GRRVSRVFDLIEKCRLRLRYRKEHPLVGDVGRDLCGRMKTPAASLRHALALHDERARQNPDPNDRESLPHECLLPSHRRGRPRNASRAPRVHGAGHTLAIADRLKIMAVREDAISSIATSVT